MIFSQFPMYRRKFPDGEPLTNEGIIEIITRSVSKVLYVDGSSII
jgi:hypothetical protein